MEVGAAPAAAAAAQTVRVCLAWQPKTMKKTWTGAVPASKPKTNKQNQKKARLPKKLRVALPEGVLDNANEKATLAHGVLAKGLVSCNREGCLGGRGGARGQGVCGSDRGRDQRARLRRRAASQLRPRRRRVGDDDMDLRSMGKGVARHAAKIMAALDRLHAPENAAAAAARGVLVQWPECLPRGVLRCPELHAFLDAWAAHVF
jgi:hypothetical protein